MIQDDLLNPKATVVQGMMCQSEETSKLSHLLYEWENHLLKVPAHQRGNDAWNKIKQQAFIDRLNDVVGGRAQPPLGVICLYQIEGQANGLWFINDGLQRLTACLKFKTDPNSFGYSTDNVMQLLGVPMHVQKRIYKGIRQAVDDFIAVNNGTGLIDSEKFIGEFVHHKDYELFWKPRLDNFHDKLNAGLSRFSRAGKGRRKAKIDSQRASRWLWAMWFQKGPANIGPKVERAVGNSFEMTDADSKIEKLIKTTDRFIAEIERGWRLYEPDTAKVMQLACARWLVALRIRYQDISPLWWSDFYAILFRKTRGKSQIILEKKSRTENLSKRTDIFASVLDELGIELPDNHRRKKPDYEMQPGYEAHHPNPFAIYGDGPTVTEPALINRALSARQIIDDKK